MPLLTGLALGVNSLAGGVSRGIDDLNKQKEIAQLSELNAKKLEQANLQIEEAGRQNEERKTREQANKAITQYTVGGSLEGINEFLNTQSAEGVKYATTKNPDGSATMTVTNPNGSVDTQTFRTKDQVNQFVLASTIVDPTALLADDIQRGREAEAAKAQQAHEINKIMVEGNMAERLERMKNGRASGKVPEYEKVYMRLAKEALGAQLGDRWNFEGKNARKAAWVSNYAAILHDRALAQNLNPNTTTIWNQAFAALESQVGDDFLISKEEAEQRSGNKLGAPHTGSGPSARQRFEKGRPVFPVLPGFGFETPGLGATPKTEEKTSSQDQSSPTQGTPRRVSAGARASLVGAPPRDLPAGAVPNGGLSVDQMPELADLPPIAQDRPPDSNGEVREEGGRFFAPYGSNKDGKTRYIELRQYPDGRWIGLNPETEEYDLLWSDQ